VTRTVLCFGDSNTYGSIPGQAGGRYDWDTRWPGVLARELGDGWRVVEEGLPGRTTVFEDPLAPYRRGTDYLPPCLGSHAPLDVVVIFLGTNDLKTRFAAGPYEIARGVGVLAEIAVASGSGPDGNAPRVLLLGLPSLAPIEQEGFEGAEEKAMGLPVVLERVATELGAELLPLENAVAYSPLDGIHLDVGGHAAIGTVVAQHLRGMF